MFTWCAEPLHQPQPYTWPTAERVARRSGRHGARRGRHLCCGGNETACVYGITDRRGYRSADDVAFVPRAKLRDELQDVRALGAPLNSPPLLRIERAAVVSFGVTSYGCHVNGFTRKNGDVYVWLAKRALSKPTYPGLLDQIAAGGLPAKTSLLENAKREAAEEASIPRDILDGNLRAAGCVSYRYAARRGLSTKTLAVFDLELPEDTTPPGARIRLLTQRPRLV